MDVTSMNKEEFVKWIQEELPEDVNFHVGKEEGYYGNKTIIMFKEKKTPHFLDIFFK